MHVCACTYTYARVPPSDMLMYTDIHKHIYECIYMYIHMVHVYIFTHIRMHSYACITIPIQTCMFTLIYTHKRHTDVYTHMRM